MKIMKILLLFALLSCNANKTTAFIESNGGIWVIDSFIIDSIEYKYDLGINMLFLKNGNVDFPRISQNDSLIDIYALKYYEYKNKKLLFYSKNIKYNSKVDFNQKKISIKNDSCIIILKKVL